MWNQAKTPEKSKQLYVAWIGFPSRYNNLVRPVLTVRCRNRLEHDLGRHPERQGLYNRQGVVQPAIELKTGKRRQPAVKRDSSEHGTRSLVVSCGEGKIDLT